MFNVRPDRRWFEFNVEPPEDPPGFRVNADGSVGGTPSGDFDQRSIGFHVQPPQQVVPGFRMNADGSIRTDAAPVMPPYPDVGSRLFSFPEPQGPSSSVFTPVGDGSPPPYLAFAERARNWLGGAPTLNRDPVQPAGMTSFEPTPLGPPPFSRSSFPGAGTGGLPFNAMPSQSFLDRPTSGDGALPASFSHTATPLSTAGELPPLSSFAGPIPGESLASADADALGVLPVSDGQQSWSDQAANPNIIRVADGDSVAPTDNVQIAQAQGQGAPQSKLKKDPSPGIAVVLPDKSTIPDPQSPTGLLMAPTADLSDVAAAGRQAKETLDKLSVFPPAYLAYLAGTLGSNVGQGGSFDYQRQGNMVTGYTHRQQFVKVSNLNVGLFAQQAGLTLEQTLIIAGEFARLRSSNADEKEGLNRTQREFITLGYRIGASGMFDRPPVR